MTPYLLVGRRSYHETTARREPPTKIESLHDIR
jgi:hypothetical protein